MTLKAILDRIRIISDQGRAAGEPLNNEHIARLLFNYKMATREQILHAMKHVNQAVNLGQVLVRQGVITEDIYQKCMAHLKKSQASPQQSKPPKEEPSRAVEHEEVDLPPVTAESDTDARTSLPESFEPQTGFGQLSVSIPQTCQTGSSLDEIFCFARKNQASDVHICPGMPIQVRRFGKLVPVTEGVLSQSEIDRKLRRAFGEKRLDEFMKSGDMEFIHTIEGGGRFRVTLMRENFGFDLTARVIPMRVMSFEESGLPEVCKSLTRWAQGMVLVTGPIGCGKTSTMAVLVDLVNQNKNDHIVTIESPIELIYQPARCQITQRELNLHTLSQGNALKAALRQDPDILVISELRDLDSIQLAVSAAETGHLVFATMNTASAMRTIYRLIDSFPPEEQDIIRNMVSLSLRGIISQQLIPKKDGSGVVPAFEVLMVNNAISNLIRKNNSHLIESAMITGKSQGMVLLDDSLEDLYKAGVIEGKEAFYRAINQKRFQAIKDK
ncbi:MAG: type IV pili twitching motility protein PilT [Acidobacteria bacterium]|nr:MAG: type IV pili twitching motility protein PilT [Acidobacteriota bacterium]PIE89616.1 MAG: type IV pili twitching motility protein PilT [Acidobacteriota bacterium]